jgi:quercetin dioxygenase-like cupin family protein
VRRLREARPAGGWRRAAALLGAGLLTLAAVTAAPGPSGAEEHPPPILVEPLTPRTTFSDDVTAQFRLRYEGQGAMVRNLRDPSRVMVAQITVQPGAQFPWHTHPGPVIVHVAEGELTYVNAHDCVERVYPAGTVFLDPGQGNVHTAFNATGDVTRLVATFFQVPETGPVTITDGVEPGDCPVGVGAAHDH